MSSAADIEVSPKELRFRFQIGKSIPSHVVLHNPTTERHAFKIKTTSPKKYCVRPASGHIEPKGTKQIEVIMQSQREYPTDAQNVRDKFLLLTTPIAATESENTPELFDKALNPKLKEARLRVVFDIPTPPETIPEHSGESDELFALPGESEIQKLRREKEELRRIIGRLEQRQNPKIPSGFTLFHLVLVAILAFVIGHYL